MYNFCLLSAKFVCPIVRKNINPTFAKSEGNMHNEGGHGLFKVASHFLLKDALPLTGHCNRLRLDLYDFQKSYI